MNMRDQGTMDEQRLAEMLHRIAPEPPRMITVEDIAIRLANQAAPPRLGRDRAGRGDTAVLRVGKRGQGRLRWAPALAAASVLAVVGASAGIGVALTSHHGKPSPPAGSLTNSAGSTSPVTASPTTGPASTHPAEPRIPIANGTWGAQLINHEAVESYTLVGSGNSLYAVTAEGYLLRFDPASGNVLQQVNVQNNNPNPNRPVVVGNTVWIIWSAGIGNVTLHGYNATTLAPAGSITVSGGGPTAASAEGILTSGPSGDLYVGAGNTVAVVDPSSGSVLRRIHVTAGVVDSVAVSPDGSKLYVAVNANGAFSLVVYNAATGAQVPGSAMTGGGSGYVGGYLVATSGGVWFSTGAAMTQQVWFAPGGNLSHPRTITSGANGGLDSVPTYVNGVVWIAGTQALECLDPSTGQVRGQTAIPADASIPEHFGSIAFAGGQAFATYQDDHAQLVGVAAVTPPSTCAA